MKIVTVIGARPQFIKAASVSRAIQKFNKRKKCVQEILIHTGQHYDYKMNQVFFKELELPKTKYHLEVGSNSHARQTGLILERIETILEKEKPNVVLVYGDTNSTLGGALASAKLSIPVAHVEAGLRSYNRKMPEEINRVLTDHLSTFLFCPTNQAVENLKKEGIKDGKERVVKNVGDVMYDSILYYSKVAEEKSTILKDLGFDTKHETRVTDYYLATLHRAENTDDPKRLKSILKALNEIGKVVPVVLPLHPRTRKMMNVYQLSVMHDRVRIIEPVSYLDMLELEKNAKLILTDSGGVQKEAYWFEVPCLTLRDETEWMETVRSGWNLLVGSEADRIIEGINQVSRREHQGKTQNEFGRGNASEKIIDNLLKFR
ncbi:MAG: non-hydrolyzing UDP-N-acetylglucosamine 2-epimerase [Thermodesulfobacteriota bacterium]